MDITKQVLSIKQMQYLVNLGLDTSDATMCWIKTPKGREVAFNDDWTGRRESLLEPIPAYTLQDLLEKLPEFIKNPDTENSYEGLDIFPEGNDWIIHYGICEVTRNKNLIDAAYEMLCWCIGKKHIKKERRKQNEPRNKIQRKAY